MTLVSLLGLLLLNAVKKHSALRRPLRFFPVASQLHQLVQQSVPLLPKSKAILDNCNEVRDYALPKFSNQKINSYLKEIGGIVGVIKPIGHHMARKTFASTVLLDNDVPMEIVSELLGHSSIKITQEYYGKIVQKRVSEEMLRISRKLR